MLKVIGTADLNYIGLECVQPVWLCERRRYNMLCTFLWRFLFGAFGATLRRCKMPDAQHLHSSA